MTTSFYNMLCPGINISREPSAFYHLAPKTEARQPMVAFPALEGHRTTHQGGGWMDRKAVYVFN